MRREDSLIGRNVWSPASEGPPFHSFLAVDSCSFFSLFSSRFLFPLCFRERKRGKRKRGTGRETDRPGMNESQSWSRSHPKWTSGVVLKPVSWLDWEDLFLVIPLDTILLLPLEFLSCQPILLTVSFIRQLLSVKRLLRTSSLIITIIKINWFTKIDQRQLQDLTVYTTARILHYHPCNEDEDHLHHQIERLLCQPNEHHLQLPSIGLILLMSCRLFQLLLHLFLQRVTCQEVPRGRHRLNTIVIILQVQRAPVVEAAIVLMEDLIAIHYQREGELEPTSMDGSWKNWRRHLKPVIILMSLWGKLWPWDWIWLSREFRSVYLLFIFLLHLATHFL